MKVKITSDSTVDLTPELLAKYDIAVVHLPVILGDKEHRDGITPQDMYDYHKRTGKLPKTAALNAQDYAEFFERELNGHDALLHISMSSGISASYNNSVEGSKQTDGDIRIIDGTTLSTGTALLAIKAHEMLQNGTDLSEVVDTLNEIKSKLQVSFLVDSMEYLYKNGRCSALSAFIATKLMVKPTIIMNAKGDGKMSPGKKYLARFEKAIIKYADDIMDANPNPDFDRVFITYTHGTPDHIVAAVKERVEQRFNFGEVLLTTAGPTITSHCGKGTLGILYLTK